MSAAWTNFVSCDEKDRLLLAFTLAVQEVIRLLEMQAKSLASTDPDSSKLETWIAAATERKLQAKYAYMKHIATHGC